jgi:hypothetical protein
MSATSLQKKFTALNLRWNVMTNKFWYQIYCCINICFVQSTTLVCRVSREGFCRFCIVGRGSWFFCWLQHARPLVIGCQLFHRIVTNFAQSRTSPRSTGMVVLLRKFYSHQLCVTNLRGQSLRSGRSQAYRMSVLINFKQELLHCLLDIFCIVNTQLNWQG